MLVNDISEKIIEIRRHIHSNPELGGKEFATTAYIMQILEDAGIKTKKITKTGIVGEVYGAARSSGKVKTIAVRADIDALPILEKTGKPYSSKNKGVMHACGHDGNASMAVGAALLLAGRRAKFSGCVKFIFQPEEETSDGAKSMIRAGALKTPVVDAIVGVHVNPWLASGVIGLKSGAMMAAVDKFEIEVLGDGGHGAYPHLGKDAVVIAGQLVTALQTIISRETDPVEPAVLTIGTINGGERFNIICDRVKLVGTVRTLNDKTRNKIKKLMTERIRFITKSFGAAYSFKYESLGNALVNSPKTLELCRKTAAGLFGSSKLKMLDKPSMGGEDFSEYLKFVPGCFVYVGTGIKNAFPWHHEKFDLDEKALIKGSMFLSETAINYLKK